MKPLIQCVAGVMAKKLCQVQALPATIDFDRNPASTRNLVTKWIITCPKATIEPTDL